MTQETKFRLSVWRPVRWPREILDADQGGPVDTSTFYESIYSRDITESPLDVIPDQDQRGRIEAIFESFALNQSPSSRTILVLKEKLTVLDEVLSNHGGGWMYSEGFVKPESGMQMNLRINRLLAFRQMVQWICDTFKDVPKAHVTLR